MNCPHCGAQIVYRFGRSDPELPGYGPMFEGCGRCGKRWISRTREPIGDSISDIEQAVNASLKRAELAQE